MSKVYIPPPSIEYMISHMVEWIARHMRAKVTLTVYISENKNFTEIYDASNL